MDYFLLWDLLFDNDSLFHMLLNLATVQFLKEKNKNVEFSRKISKHLEEKKNHLEADKS